MIDIDIHQPRFWIPQADLNDTQRTLFNVLSSHRWAYHTECHCQCGLFCNRDGHDAHLAQLLWEAVP